MTVTTGAAARRSPHAAAARRPAAPLHSTTPRIHSSRHSAHSTVLLCCTHLACTTATAGVSIYPSIRRDGRRRAVRLFPAARHRGQSVHTHAHTHSPTAHFPFAKSLRGPALALYVGPLAERFTRRRGGANGRAVTMAGDGTGLVASDPGLQSSVTRCFALHQARGTSDNRFSIDTSTEPRVDATMTRVHFKRALLFSFHSAVVGLLSAALFSR